MNVRLPLIHKQGLLTPAAESDRGGFGVRVDVPVIFNHYKIHPKRCGLLYWYQSRRLRTR